MTRKSGRDAYDFLEVTYEAPEPPPPVKQIRLVVPEYLKEGAINCVNKIRQLFGKNGEYWITGEEHTIIEKGEIFNGKEAQRRIDQFCLVGGINKVDGKYEGVARAAITLAIMEKTGDVESRLDEINDEQDIYYTKDRILEAETITDFNDSQEEFRPILDIINRAKQLIKKADTE